MNSGLQNQKKPSTLRILHLEDEAADAALVQMVIEQAGMQCTLHWTQTRAAFETALDQERFDLIILDYSLPGFHGLAALKTVQDRAPDCPAIFVSNTLEEEVVVEAIRSGAVDYVSKNRLKRLPAAIRRAVDDAASQQALQRARRLETVSALAGKLAHDLNNVLTPVFLGIDLLCPGIPEKETRVILESLKNTAERGAGIVAQMASFAQPTAGESELPFGHGETILVAAGEGSTVEIVREMLAAFDYRVLTVRNGEDAVEMFSQHSARIAALVCDLRLPAMDAPTTIRKLREMRPDLRVLVFHGAETEPLRGAIQDLGVGEVLRKPFTTAQLLRALSRVLQRASARD